MFQLLEPDLDNLFQHFQPELEAVQNILPTSISTIAQTFVKQLSILIDFPQ